MSDRDGRRWYDFNGYRRRFVSDLTWFGAAFIVVGVAGLIADPGLPGWLAAALTLVGVGLLALPIRRRMRAHR